MHDTTWIWAVVGGLAIAGVLLFHILNGIVSALPPEVRAPITASAKANSRPLAVLAVVVLWTATYALYSMAHITGSTALSSASGTPATSNAPTATAPGAAGTAPTARGAGTKVVAGTPCHEQRPPGDRTGGGGHCTDGRRRRHEGGGGPRTGDHRRRSCGRRWDHDISRRQQPKHRERRGVRSARRQRRAGEPDVPRL